MSDNPFRYEPDPSRELSLDTAQRELSLNPSTHEFSLDPARRELEVAVTDELALAESSRPDDPVVESDAGWRPNPTEIKAYEARLLALRAAAEVLDDQNGTEVISESVAVISIEADD
jgi:hypothetical protein